MGMFKSINGDVEIHIYILDNLFSFCHKDGMSAWGIEHRAWRFLVGSWKRDLLQRTTDD
jgi:hypothetical protein